MVDLKILEKHGCSAEAWKPKLISRGKGFTQTGAAGLPERPKYPDDKLNRLVERVRSRIQEAREYNIGNFKTFHTMDLVWGAPYRHISPTLLSSIVDKYEAGKVEEVVKFFGYDPSKVLTETMELDSKTKSTKKILDYPAFFAITIPIVRSYLQIRRAKILNDRNLDPFISYEPVWNNQEDRVRCEVLSSVVNRMAKQFGYLEVLNQAIFQMLLYSRCFVFPREEWYTEKQLRYVDVPSSEPAPPTDEEFPGTGISTPQPVIAQSPKEEEYVTKQGIRAVIPHPSRTYFDKAFPAKSINFDCGATYLGHWQISRYREILDDEAYYNTDRIYAGNSSWFDTASHFFSSVYNRCAIKTPTFTVPDDVQDRDAWLATNAYYSSDMLDQSVFLCNHYEKLIPSKDGLGDYDHPIWARFVVAGDDTIIYAAPTGYVPAACFEDNVDAKRLEDASFALTLTPFQDQLSNQMSQYLLSVRQNLANITLLDKNIFPTSIIEKIRNTGEALFRQLNIFEFDSRKLTKGQFGLGQAIFSHRFPYLDVNGTIQSIRMTLDLAERVLQFSSQEIARQATHEQTRREIDEISNSTGNILAYTGIPVDYGIEAMANMFYEGLMNYGEDDFIASVPSAHNVTPELLDRLGFTVLSEPKSPNERFKVKVKKTALMLLSFGYIPDPSRRVTNIAAATTLSTFMRDMMNNPITANAIGGEQAIQVANQIAAMAGLRLARPLENVGLTPEEQAGQNRQLLEQVVNQVLADTDAKIKPIGERLDNLVKALNLSDVVPEAPAEAGAGGESAATSAMAPDAARSGIPAPAPMPGG